MTRLPFLMGVAAVLGASPVFCLISIRPVAHEELLRFARFRAAAFSGTDTASAARVQAVHKLVEERVACGGLMLAALADGADAERLGASELDDAAGDGWHPGLEGSNPLEALSGALGAIFKTEPESTMVESLGDCRIVAVADVVRRRPSRGRFEPFFPRDCRGEH